MNTSPVTTEWLSVTTPDGPMAAYLARPPAGRGPGLLLLQEIFGVNAHIRGVAEQYALAGFTVLALDAFWRQAPRVELSYVGEDRDRALTLMRGLSREQAVADMSASIAALKAHSACTGRVGAIGYCMGGRLAFAAAALCNGLERAVCYYGGGIATQLELAKRIYIPTQFHHAEVDASIPPEAVASVKANVMCCGVSPERSKSQTVNPGRGAIGTGPSNCSPVAAVTSSAVNNSVQAGAPS